MLWTIGSAVGQLVAPPAILLILLALGLWNVQKKWGLRLAWVSLALLWILATPIVSYSLMDALSHEAVPVDITKLPKERAMIVALPGGKVFAREYPRGETVGALTVQRMRYAAWLAKATGLAIAIPGGKHDGVYTESELARNFLETELHQPVALTEHTSLDTRQNALNLVEPLRARNVETVVLVTDARHMPRAAAAFETLGFKVIRAPMAIATGEGRFQPLGFLPTAQGLDISYDVSHEIIGRLWYAIRALATRLL
jgi:uncharacterized SAM-binding protein YcdF (DUF218 family)